MPPTTTTTTTTTTTITTTTDDAPYSTATAAAESYASNGKKSYPTTTDKSSHPFYAFVDLIGNDDAALHAFCADPYGDPAAAYLTAVQKEALLSGEWKLIEAQVAAENRRLQTTVYEQIGWILHSVAPKIVEALKAKAPS
jgi:hypothetical protein